MFGKRKMKVPTACFGVLAEFEDGEALLDAIEKCKQAGFSRMEAYTPLPMHEVCHALGYQSRLPLLVLIGGIVGGLAGFGMQYFASVVHYPINVGGRPLNSWPSFVVITFEMTILFAAASCVFGMLALNGLPRPHHPVFDVEEFETASRDRFFLLLMAHDPRFTLDGATEVLKGLAPSSITEVPNP